MLADHEEAISPGYPVEHLRRAEVPVGDVHVPGLHGGDHRFDQTALLSVPVLAADDLRDQPGLRLHHDQRLARQRTRRAILKHRKAPIRRCQVIAVENLDPMPLQPGLVRRSKLLDDRTEALRRVSDQRLARADLHAVDLRIKRRQAHRDLLAHHRVGLVDRRLHPADDQRHHLDHRREQKLLLVLPLRVLAEQRVQPLRLQRSLHQRTRHHCHRVGLRELVEHAGENHLSLLHPARSDGQSLACRRAQIDLTQCDMELMDPRRAHLERADRKA